MKHPQEKNVLFWSLVAGCFLVILALWLPSLKNNVLTFGSSINSDAANTKDSFSKQLTRAQKLFEGYVTPPPGQTSTTTKEVLGSIADSFKKEFEKESSTLPISDTLQKPILTETNDAKKFCTQKGGYHQDRKGSGEMLYSVCIFSDGSECEEQAFSKDECHVGQYTVAEKGIIKKADLIVMVKKVDYCIKKSQGVEWVDEEVANAICAEGVSVKNNGWAASARSHAIINDTFYPIPALAQGEVYQLIDTVSIVKTSKTTQLRIVADAKKNIDELYENNNEYIFPDAGTLKK